jgi:hypothetical protein
MSARFGAQAMLNLPAGLPLTSFITPDGKLYFGAGYLPSEGKGGKQSFKDAAEQALKEYADKQDQGRILPTGGCKMIRKNILLNGCLLLLLGTQTLFGIDNLKLNSEITGDRT